MLDIIIFFDENRYKNRVKIKDLFRLTPSKLTDDDDRYVFENEHGHCFLDFVTELETWEAEELKKVPYDVYGVCYLTSSCFDIILDMIRTISAYDCSLYLDDDHGNIVSLPEYIGLADNGDVYPLNFDQH